MASPNENSNVVTNSSNKDDNDDETEAAIEKNDSNDRTGNDDHTNAFDDAENDQHLTFNFTESNSGNKNEQTKNINSTCTSIEETSSSSSLVNNDSLINDTSDDRKVTNDSTDSDSFISMSPSTSIEKKITQQRKGNSSLLDSDSGLNENVVKLICQTVESTLKSYLSKYNFKRKTRNKHGRRKKSSKNVIKTSTIKEGNKNDTTITTKLNQKHIFCLSNPEPFNLETDIFGINNDMMEIQNDITNNVNLDTGNENAPGRLSPQVISDMVDKALNDGHANIIDNDNQDSQLDRQESSSSSNNHKGNLEKLSNNNLVVNLPHVKSGDNQAAVISQIPLSTDQPPWWFRDNILLATEFLNKGTSSVKFEHCFLEDENVKTKLFETLRTQSLTFMPQYENKSFEELRCEDYILQEMGANIRHRINPGDYRGATGTSLEDPSQHRLVYGPTYALEEFLNKKGEIERSQIKYHCISCMKDFGNLSFEELRLDHYTKNNIEQDIMTARAREVTTNLNSALGETALKNYRLLERNSSKTVDYNECMPTTSKDADARDSMFKNSLFNDSETIAKTIFTKSHNPFYNPFTHSHLPQFKLENPKFDFPKDNTEKSVFDVTPAKVNFVFNPDTSPLKKTSVKPKSNLQNSKETNIISKSDDTSKLLFGWSCKPFNFSNPSEPILKFNDTSKPAKSIFKFNNTENQKFAKTTNSFGAIPKYKGSVLSNDIFRATIDKLLNENNNPTNEECVVNSNKNGNASTSSMDTQITQKQMDTVLKESSQLLNKIDVLYSDKKIENEKMKLNEAKPEEKDKNRAINDNQNSGAIKKCASTSKFTSHEKNNGFNGRSFFEKFQSNSPKKYNNSVESNDTKKLLSSSTNKNDNNSDSTYFSFSNVSKKKKNNDDNNQSKQGPLNVFKAAPVSSLFNTSAPSTTFNFSFSNSDKQHDKKLVNSKPGNSLTFKESETKDNPNKNNPFFLKPFEPFDLKVIKSDATTTSNAASSAKNSSPMIFGEHKNKEFQFKQTPTLDESSKLDQTFKFVSNLKNETNFDNIYFGHNKSEFKKSSPIDIKLSKPFGSINHSLVDSNSQSKQLSKENQSIAGSSLFNQQNRPDFEVKKPIVREQSSGSLALYSNRGLYSDNRPIQNSKNTNPESIFGTPKPSISIFKPCPPENILRQTPDSDRQTPESDRQTPDIDFDVLQTAVDTAIKKYPIFTMPIFGSSESSTSIFKPSPPENILRQTPESDSDSALKTASDNTISKIPTFTMPIFRTTEPSTSIFKPSPPEIILRQTPEIDSGLVLKTASENTIKNNPIFTMPTFGTLEPSTSKPNPPENILRQPPERDNNDDLQLVITTALDKMIKNNNFSTFAMPNSSNNESTLNLNLTANETHLWKSVKPFKRCTTKPIVDNNASGIYLGSSLHNMSGLSASSCLINADQSYKDTGLNASLNLDITTSNNQAYDLPILMSDNPMEAKAAYLAMKSYRQFDLNFSVSNHDSSYGLSNRVFNCIDESKVKNSADRARELDAFNKYIVSNLTDDSSEDDDDTLSETVSNIVSYPTDFDYPESPNEPVATNIVNEMTDNRSFNSQSDVPRYTPLNIGFDVLVNPDSTSKMDRVDTLKRLKIRRLNCEQNENGADDAHVRYIFSQTTVKCGCKIDLHLRDIKKIPKLYIGLTTCNPNNLTDFEMPYQPGDLCERTESWTLKDVSQALNTVRKITMHFRTQGVVQIIYDNTNIQHLLIDYSVSTWPFVVIQSGHVEIDFLTNDIHPPVEVAKSAVEVAKSDCVICYENPVDTVLYKCGHSCLCLKCGKIMLKNLGSCPICRDMIIDVIKIYTT